MAVNVRSWLRGNPVVLKELRGRMRGARAFILITVYVLLMALVVGFAYLAYVASASISTYAAPQDRQMFGKVFFGLVVGMELLSITFIAPALTAGAISSEREHQTFDLLRTTVLPARTLVYGKFFSALTFVMLLLFAALPLQSMAFLFGGVAIEEILISTLMLIVTALHFCSLGIFFSSFNKHTLVSTVLSYAVPILTVFGLPLLALIFGTMFASLIDQSIYTNPLSLAAERILTVIIWFLVSINPLTTMIGTEVLLIEEHSAFIYNVPLNNGTFPVLSPWIPYALIYTLLSLILLVVAMAFVRRRER